MLETLQTPLKAFHLLLAALAALLSVTVYCLAYTAFSGRAESPVAALSWAIINVLPWLAAFEIGKRSRGLGGRLLALAAAMVVSLGLDLLIGDHGGLGFELVRRIPGLLITTSLLTVLPLRAEDGSVKDTAGPKELPMRPEHIDWIRAAGNYVELHGCGRTLLHRTPLSRLEAQLATVGFVRVHRSTLVRREGIARVRPLDILLHDGTSLRTGKRYRALLQEQNFVPSSHLAGSHGIGRS